MNIKYFFKKNKYTKKYYPVVYDFYYRRKYLTGKHKFIDRSHNCSKLCIVLAGYKEYLIPSVMGRLKKYTPNDVDVCIVSSGKWSETLDNLCSKNSWSYLSTNRNNVSLAQNIAIDLHKKANYIYKLDEDIFITEHYFENMMKAYKYCEKHTDYNVGVVAPLLPINGYGHVKIIEKYQLIEVYQKEFGDLKIAGGVDRPIETNSELACFMWGKEIECDGLKYRLPSIDSMNSLFASGETKIESCPIRFSIGAILFERKLWKEMDYFHVGKGTDMGKDEIQLCEFCMLNSKPIMVSNNIVVGHLGFGRQNEAMKQYYEKNLAVFRTPEDE